MSLAYLSGAKYLGLAHSKDRYERETEGCEVSEISRFGTKKNDAKQGREEIQK